MSQCTAKSKRTRNRCTRPAMKGGTVCYHHGGAAPQVRAAAARRLRDLQPKVIVAYEDALTQTDDLPSRIRAADSVAKLTAMGDMDRAIIEALDPGRRELPNEVLTMLLELAERESETTGRPTHGMPFLAHPEPPGAIGPAGEVLTTHSAGKE